MVHVPIGQKMTKGNKGALCELVVAADLLSKGYHVFRACSPHAPYDLVADVGDRLLRIEVKSVTFIETIPPSKLAGLDDTFDVFAAVQDGDQIRYFGLVEDQ